MRTTNSYKAALWMTGVLALIVAGLSVAYLSGWLGGASSGRINEVDPSPLAGAAPTLTAPTLSAEHDCANPVQYLVPEKGTPCNGCTVTVGEKFTLDLMVHALDANITAQQSYLLFSNDRLQSVDTSAVDCKESATVAPDPTVYDTVLQNAVCNGPERCSNNGLDLAPGSIAYASGALANCPTGCKGDARAAQISFCARAIGSATIKWQFQEPGRQTMLVGFDNRQFSTKTCYATYAINISSK